MRGYERTYLSVRKAETIVTPHTRSREAHVWQLLQEFYNV